ncbi:MAG: hypothetical protein JWP08_1967, partial [Bryobacterales bacterium]|nr:hypothetical protein [Bryobacterales bacterium]
MKRCMIACAMVFALLFSIGAHAQKV